ncbi:hypothetical protein BN855_12150 [Salmonella enterica subsp. enterica serovar Bovismorbificans str. 3114]|nr:hypothetical protein BN855_12150 [Salmonella enterica subsp. enterica serovar Bovismorbificans str. 3114]
MFIYSKCFALIQKRQNTIRAYSDDSILFLQFAGIKKPPHERGGNHNMELLL